jgi:DegV family protein with EDD domain
MAAARASAVGEGMREIQDRIQRLIPAMRSYGILDTLKYIIKGGRLGKAGAAVGSLLPVKPILTIKDGGIAMVGVARTRSNAVERLLDLLKSVPNVQNIGIAHSSPNEEIASFVERLKAFLPDVRPTIARLGPAIGTHGGPGTILVALQQELGKTDASLEAAGKKQIISLPSIQALKDSVLQRKQKETAPFFRGSAIPAAVQ